jgi:hypothetical protein
MLGTILFVDEATGTGVIRADDGKRYRFSVSEWPAGSTAAAGIRVDFDTDGDSALAPLPISPDIAPLIAGAAPTPPEPSVTGPAAAEPVTPTSPMSIAETPAAATPPTPATPTTAFDSVPAPSDPQPPIADGSGIAAEPIAAQPAEPTGTARPVPISTDEVPEYIGLSEPDAKGGGMSGLWVGGGAILLLMLAALAYMMWDNAETAGEPGAIAADDGESIALYAQEDLPVRNVAAMTNATVLGRIARGDRVSGVEVAGSADPTSRWLRLDGGNRFVPMTGLGPSAPPAIAAPDAPPPPVAPPVDGAPDELNDSFGAQGGDYNTGPNGPVDALPPVIPVPPANPDRQIRPDPRVRPVPPVRPRPQPERPVTPSRPLDTRPVVPQRPIAPQRGTDPRDTQPVGR